MVDSSYTTSGHSGGQTLDKNPADSETDPSTSPKVTQVTIAAPSTMQQDHDASRAASDLPPIETAAMAAWLKSRTPASATPQAATMAAAATDETATYTPIAEKHGTRAAAEAPAPPIMTTPKDSADGAILDGPSSGPIAIAVSSAADVACAVAPATTAVQEAVLPTVTATPSPTAQAPSVSGGGEPPQLPPAAMSFAVGDISEATTDSGDAAAAAAVAPQAKPEMRRPAAAEMRRSRGGGAA